jgi:hypothetical protein
MFFAVLTVLVFGLGHPIVEAYANDLLNLYTALAVVIFFSCLVFT